MANRLRIPLIPPAATPVSRSVASSLWRGFRGRCPQCGIGRVLQGYLKVRAVCPHCGERLGHIKADDGPAYFTVLIAGHVMVPLVLVAEQTWHPPIETTLAVSLVGLGLLIWRLLPRVKGAVLGLMWALGLSGDEVQEDL